MTRETLPNRRFAAGYQYTHGGQSYMAHVGFYPDGRMAELFVTGAKPSTDADTVAREASTLLSFALQYGAPPEKLRVAMPRDPQGRAMGPVGAIMDILHHESTSHES